MYETAKCWGTHLQSQLLRGTGRKIRSWSPVSITQLYRLGYKPRLSQQEKKEYAKKTSDHI